jgi:hypothetical protein
MNCEVLGYFFSAIQFELKTVCALCCFFSCSKERALLFKQDAMPGIYVTFNNIGMTACTLVSISFNLNLFVYVANLIGNHISLGLVGKKNMWLFLWSISFSS